MDDYKRSMYLQVRNKLEHHLKSNADTYMFVCYELEEVLISEGVNGLIRCNYLEEMFPEFFDLFDWCAWLENGTCYDADGDDAWWENGWMPPRIRALDCILRD